MDYPNVCLVNLIKGGRLKTKFGAVFAFIDFGDFSIL